LGPLTYRLEVDADDCPDEGASGADDAGILDELAELQPVLDVGGDVALSACRPHDLRHPPQDNEGAILLELSRIARVEPAVAKRLGRGLLILEIAVEDIVGADQDLPGLVDPDLDAREGAADGRKADVLRGLGNRKRSGFRLPVELPQVEPEGPEEEEDILPDGFSRGIGALHPREAQVILDRAVDQQLAEGALDPGARARAPPFQPGPLQLDGEGHEDLVEAALQGRGFGDAD